MFERFRTFFLKFSSQGSIFYTGLTKGRKIALGMVAAMVLTFVFIIAMWKPSVNYEVGYSNLSQEDKTAILAFLKRVNVKDFKVDGDTISFPEETALDIKMQLAQEGLPNSGTGVGWEKFDDRSFGVTDFDQKISKIRAIQGELARTINKLEPIHGSRVHIVLPENSVFANEKRNPTASVYLRLKQGKSLTPRQIQGMVHLVARAVEGLVPQNISIVDQEGNLLTQPEDEDGGLDRVTNTQREYQRKMERELELKVRDILSRVVGPNKVVAKVQADVDFKKVETTVQDVDPERQVVVSSQRSEQNSKGNGTNPTGVPGAKSNLPGEAQDLAVGGGSSQSNSQSMETLNFDNKKTLSKIIEPVGNLKKLSVAVLVDQKFAEGKFAARTKEEMQMITNLVKNAIGFQDARDSITVESTQFELDEFAVAEQASLTARKTSLLQTGIIACLGIAAMIFLFFAVVRPYFKWLTFDPDKRSLEELKVLDYELERSGGNAKRVQVKEEIPFDKLSPREQIMYMAKHDPQKTTEALRHLLSPGGGQH